MSSTFSSLGKFCAFMYFGGNVRIGAFYKVSNERVTFGMRLQPSTKLSESCDLVFHSESVPLTP